MRLFLPVVLLALIASRDVFSQANSLFAPYDCRKHQEPFVELVPPFAVDPDIDNEAVLFEDSEMAAQESGWREWAYVENYAFTKDRGAMTMITDLNALHPYFRDRISLLIAACKAKGIELAVVESYRTHAKQHEYKTMGKGYTNSGAGKSKHQYGLAVDVVPLVKGVPVWNNTALWRKVGMVGEKLGLRWGGRWKRPYDPGHFEWTGGLATSSLYAGSFPVVPNAEELYPCLEDDIITLKKYWNAWETEQSSVSRSNHISSGGKAAN